MSCNNRIENIIEKPKKQSIYKTCPECKTKIYCVPHVCSPPVAYKKNVCKNVNFYDKSIECPNIDPAKHMSFKKYEKCIEDQIHIFDPEFESMYGEFLRYNPSITVYKRKPFKAKGVCKYGKINKETGNRVPFKKR